MNEDAGTRSKRFYVKVDTTRERAELKDWARGVVNLVLGPVMGREPAADDRANGQVDY